MITWSSLSDLICYDGYMSLQQNVLDNVKTLQIVYSKMFDFAIYSSIYIFNLLIVAVVTFFLFKQPIKSECVKLAMAFLYQFMSLYYNCYLNFFDRADIFIVVIVC